MAEVLPSKRATSVTPAGIIEPLRAFVPRVAGVLRERAVLESFALLIPIVLVGVGHAAGVGLWIACAGFAVASIALAVRAPARSRIAAGAVRWTTARILLSVAIVAAAQLLTGATGLLAAVYLPIVAIAAFAGLRVMLVALVAAVVAQLGVETIDMGDLTVAALRLPGFASAAALVAYGTRREVARMQRARDRLRKAAIVERRRGRQIAGVEAIGRILASYGPTADALDEIVGRISGELGYKYVSIYLGTERIVHLGAQRGYGQLVPTFDGTRGIVGRVMRTGQPAFVPDVSADPDYWGINPSVTSEICVPLLPDREFAGFVNVEAIGGVLDATDLRIMTAVADRLSASLIIGRERQRLAERAELFRHLHEFSEAINATLQPDELYRAVVRSVSNVVPADVAALHVLDRDSGRYLLRAVEGGDLPLGEEAKPGEGMAGRAIRDHVVIVDEAAPHLRPAADAPAWPMAAVAIPLIRENAVLGVLTLSREDPGQRFNELERDALAMLAEQAVLAITNVSLHAEVAELALRDPLTGLFNRRYLDPALTQLFARQTRLPVAERVQLSAIMFDLDHFSRLNNRHGHQIGDEVLRAFGGILRARMRTTDLVARFGGEEFCAILFRASLDDAVRIADEIRAELAATPIEVAPGETITATVSAGCAAAGPEEETAEELLRAADVALYMAKRAGRDRVCAA